MRLSIRWKLMLAIAVPLLAIYAVMGVQTYRASYDRAIQDQRLRAQTLSMLFAARLEGQLGEIAQVADTAASFLTTHPSIAQSDLYQIIDANLKQHALIYGSCIAFEPDAHLPGRRWYAPYGFKSETGHTFIDIGKDAYDYFTWEWYAAVREQQVARWTEPYFDEGAGNILMCTYSAPFFNEAGSFRGVVTVDLPLVPLHRYVTDSELAGQFMVISQQGRFIAAPDPDMIMKGIDQYEGRMGEALYRRVAHNVEERQTCFMRFEHFPGGSPQWVYFQPMQSAGWTFAAVFPESQVLAPVYRILRRQSLMMAVELTVVLVVLLGVGWWITGPITRMGQAVRELTAGNLHAKVTGVKRGDELGDLAAAYNRMVDHLDAQVHALAAESAAREVVEHELRTAHQIQSLLLPRALSPYPERSAFDLCAVCEPGSGAGDYYDHFFVERTLLAIVLAKVDGAGVPAALFMAVTRTIIRNLLSDEQLPGPALARANELLFQDNEHRMSVSMFCAVYDTRTGRMFYADAGNPPPVLIAADGSIRSLDTPPGPLLGVTLGEIWEQHSLVLAPREKLVLYNHGPDQIRDALGQPLGHDGMVRLFAQAAHDDPRLFCRSIQTQTAQLQDEPRQGLTLLILRHNQTRQDLAEPAASQAAEPSPSI